MVCKTGKKKMELGGVTGDPLGGKCGKNGCKTVSPTKVKGGGNSFFRSGSDFSKKKAKWI